MNLEDLAARFHEQVVATYNDFTKQHASAPYGNEQDARAGYLASLAAYHFREQLEGDIAVELSQVASECPDYLLLRDVADIAKHRRLGRASAVLRDPDAIQEVIIVTHYEDERGPYSHSEKQVQLLIPNGTPRSLADVLANVVAFWQAHLLRHGVPILDIDIRPPSVTEPRQRAVCSEVPLAITRGLRANLRFKIQRYNYESGVVEDVDLAGKELGFRIFEPQSVDVVVTQAETGIEHVRTVVLTPSESSTFGRLETDEDRSRFLSSLESVRAAKAELADLIDKSQSDNVDAHSKGET